MHAHKRIGLQRRARIHAGEKRPEPVGRIGRVGRPAIPQRGRLIPVLVLVGGRLSFASREGQGDAQGKEEGYVLTAIRGIWLN